MTKKMIHTISSVGTFLLIASALAVTVSAANGPVSTAPGQNKLLCFDGTTDGGYGGTCTLKANGAKGPATLNNTDSNVNGDYAGVYIQNSTLFGQPLSKITQLGYNYSGNITPQPGNLSLNLPLDTDNNVNTTETYAFIDAYYCPGTNGVVDVIHDANCGIWVNGIEYANWSALVSANPTWNVANNYAFVIAERTPSEPSALWTVGNVTLGKAGK
jgi:hypothetical protein